MQQVDEPMEELEDVSRVRPIAATLAIPVFLGMCALLPSLAAALGNHLPHALVTRMILAPQIVFGFSHVCRAGSADPVFGAIGGAFIAAILWLTVGINYTMAGNRAPVWVNFLSAPGVIYFVSMIVHLLLSLFGLRLVLQGI